MISCSFSNIRQVGSTEEAKDGDDDIDCNCRSIKVRRKFHNQMGSGFTVTAFSNNTKVLMSLVGWSLLLIVVVAVVTSVGVGVGCFCSDNNSCCKVCHATALVDNLRIMVGSRWIALYSSRLRPCMLMCGINNIYIYCSIMNQCMWSVNGYDGSFILRQW